MGGCFHNMQNSFEQKFRLKESWLLFTQMKTLGGPPHPVIVTIRGNRDYIRVLLYSHYTTITGWGVLLMKTFHPTSAGAPAPGLVLVVLSSNKIATAFYGSFPK